MPTCFKYFTNERLSPWLGSVSLHGSLRLFAHCIEELTRSFRPDSLVRLIPFFPATSKMTFREKIRDSFHRKQKGQANAPIRSIYPYQQLAPNHIRLVGLHPNESGAPIRCSLQTVNLLDYDDLTATAEAKEIKHYDAISYAWGDPKVTSPINCEFESWLVLKAIALPISPEVGPCVTRRSLFKLPDSCLPRDYKLFSQNVLPVMKGNCHFEL